MLRICIFACLLMATQAIAEDVMDGLGEYYSDINIDRILEPEGTNEDENKVLSNRTCESKKKCKRKNGVCISTNDTCIGNSFKGKKWCKNIKRCQCCIPTDCFSRTRPACSALNGTCIGVNEICDGRIVSHGKVFCKNPKTCKCCFPKGASDCAPFVCGQANSQAPFVCGQANSQVRHDCSGTKTEIVGKNTTWSTSSAVFKSGMTLGIRFLPEPGPHAVHVRVIASGDAYSAFSIRLTEDTCSDLQGCKWWYNRWTRNDTIWKGTTIPCLPKNEWMLLTITDLFNGSVDATLQVREEFYSLSIPVTVANSGVTISVNHANSQKHSEISLDCTP